MSSGRLVREWGRWRQVLSARDAFVEELREKIADGVLAKVLPETSRRSLERPPGI
jgi:hypothetical protein